MQFYPLQFEVCNSGVYYRSKPFLISKTSTSKVFMDKTFIVFTIVLSFAFFDHLQLDHTISFHVALLHYAKSKDTYTWYDFNTNQNTI